MLTFDDRVTINKASENIKDGLICLGNAISKVAEVMKSQQEASNATAGIIAQLAAKFMSNEEDEPESTDAN